MPVLSSRLSLVTASVLAAVALIVVLLDGEDAPATSPPLHRPAVEYSPLHHNEHNAVVHAKTGKREVAITFDDGPDPRWTPRFLRLLERHEARATFFLVGWRAMAYPSIVHEQLEGGHELGNHTFHHPQLPRLSSAAIESELARGRDGLERAGAPRPRVFRPPYGLFNERVGELASRAGEAMVTWDRAVDPLIRRRGPAYAARVLLRYVEPGSIILAHDGSLHPHRSYRAIELLLRGLERKRYAVVPAGTLLGLSARPG